LIQRNFNPRLIKTHFPVQMLSPKVAKESKIVYVGRNLKDVCVSLWHHMDEPGGDFKLFSEAFKAGELMPGDWPGHIKDAWTRQQDFDDVSKADSNLCFVWYEDMKRNLSAIVDKLATFLGVPKLTEEKKEALLEYLDIKNFRNNTAVNKSHEIGEKATTPFIRKGVVGDHSNYFDDAMETDWDDWLQTEFNGTGIDMACHH
jgi:hypothetical protein